MLSSFACEPPKPLAMWLTGANGCPVVPLESLGVSVRQGLRTGANGFFYSTLLSDDGVKARVLPEGVATAGEVEVPLACIRPVIRRQADLTDDFTVSESSVPGRVLDVRTYALPEDIEAGGPDARRSYAPMPESLASFVRMAALVDFGKSSKPTRVYELSAVVTNIRKGSPAKGLAARFWYMLPDFAPRHYPDLLMPRVISETPKAWLVGSPGLLVDANFSTVRMQGNSSVTVHALLALLNSTWCKAVLEFSAAVVGVGALKVEATHLRRMPIPDMSAREWERLSILGRSLADGRREIGPIDELITSALFGRASTPEQQAMLSSIAEEGRSRRVNNRRNKTSSDNNIEIASFNPSELKPKKWLFRNKSA